jgi:hypothetical protein
MTTAVGYAVKLHLSPTFQIGASILSCADTVVEKNRTKNPKKISFFILFLLL